METATGTSKRLRVSSNITQVSSCLVDGCTYDLSKCRDYHRRHKVCEPHSKTAKVFIKGQERRFCQQCSRFHSVVEFDEGKRSCRKRLEGHNRRRRKPQPDPLSLNSGALFPIHQGTRYLDFSSSQLFSASATNTSWSGAVKAENNSLPYSSQSPLNFSERKDLFYGSESHSYGGRENQLPFTETTGSMFSGDSVCQPTLPASSAMQYSGGSGKVVSDGLNLVTDSSRALSLLSSSSAEIGFSHLMQLEEKTSAQTVISSLNNYNCLGVESEPVESVLVSDGSSNANVHGRDLYQIAPAEPSVSGREERLSFSWE